MEDALTSTVVVEPKVAEPISKPKKVAAKKATKNSSAKKVSKRKKAAKNVVKKASLLSAAFKVLQGSKKPLTIKEILTKVTNRKLWFSPHGCKMPHQSLSAAIQRSILKPPFPFRRAGRGLFAVKK